MTEAAVVADVAAPLPFGRRLRLLTYAAIPSLHGGYSWLIFLFIATLVWNTRWRWTAALAFLYPVVQCFAAVYTGNHYVIDLLIGFVYATAALFGVRWFWRRMGWPE